MRFSTVFASVFIGLAIALPIDLDLRTSFAPLEKRVECKTGSDWRCELMNGQCRAVTVIYARGTTANGNVGDAVGPRLFNEIKALEGSSSVTSQGVTYDAAVAGFLDGGSDDGGYELARLVRLAISCSSTTKIVVAGYSQGAQVAYKGVGHLTSAQAGHIKAVTLFGNPRGSDTFPKVSASNVHIWCHADDSICKGSAVPNLAHQGYDHDTPSAAKFIHARV